MIKIYTKQDCKFCNMLKSVLKQNNVEYSEVDLSIKANRDEFISVYPGVKSVPYGVDENGKAIGTGDYRSVIESIIKEKKNEDV